MNPTLSKRVLSAIQKLVTGDKLTPNGTPIAPYRSGPQLVEFFNELGFNDSYSWGGGFPTRSVFAAGRLDQLNGQPGIVTAIETAMNPAEFIDTDFKPEAAARYLNRYLVFDGWEVVASGDRYRMRRRGENLVACEAKLEPDQHASHEYIKEQLDKCERKLRDDDYDGAITNARSVVESVLADVERRLDLAPPKYDGDIVKLYKRVQKLLNLDPERKDISDNLKQLLGGLASIVAGLAPLRNKMSDAHVRTYKPARHHAKLAVNAAKTLLDFVYDTFEYQKSAGRIREHEAVQR
ncbi:MAG: abortive infection family protein [Planctomycetaceae bacterium]|nr:abortive infection family protein [Planctomycetaceae bacterium]